MPWMSRTTSRKHWGCADASSLKQRRFMEGIPPEQICVAYATCSYWYKVCELTSLSIGCSRYLLLHKSLSGANLHPCRLRPLCIFCQVGSLSSVQSDALTNTLVDSPVASLSISSMSNRFDREKLAYDDVGVWDVWLSQCR